MKHLLKDTEISAKAAPASIPVFFRTAFTVLAHWKAFSASRFRLSSEAGNADRNLPTASCFRLSKDKTEALYCPAGWVLFFRRRTSRKRSSTEAMICFVGRPIGYLLFAGKSDSVFTFYSKRHNFFVLKSHSDLS